MLGHFRFASTAVLILSLSVSGMAQTLVAPRAQPVSSGGLPQIGGSQERLAVVDPDKKLAVGDQVTLEIVEDGEGGLPRVITATGDLDVPAVGRVRVSGKTAVEAAAAIKALLERDYYYHATVRLAIDRVSPVSVRAGEVYLSGEIRIGGPQEIVAGQTLTLTNAILRAGGPTDWADQNNVQITRLKRDGGLDKRTVSFKRIIKSGDARLDPVLQDGDRIFIPKRSVRWD